MSGAPSVVVVWPCHGEPVLLCSFSGKGFAILQLSSGSAVGGFEAVDHAAEEILSWGGREPAPLPSGWRHAYAFEREGL